MKYIVWRTPFKSFDYPQGDGYFVRWKNKCSDEFSPKWFDAKKYTSIGSALNRLGIEINDHIHSFEDFYKINRVDFFKKREDTISEILGEEKNNSLFFIKGHIDKIDDKGNFVGNAAEDIINYIESVIEQNIGKSKSLKKKFEKLGVDSYIDNSISDEDFWKEVLK
jgi:hypothetical protein